MKNGIKMKINLPSKIVILANGSFPTHKIPLEILNKAETVICCDGSADILLTYGKTPDFIIGDMDSLSGENKTKFIDRIIHLERQSDNDLSKAILWAPQNGVIEIQILGATGNREDHTIGNISLMLNNRFDVALQMITDFGIFTMIQKETSFQSFKGQPVSIFSEDSSTKITSNNLKYPLTNTQLKHLYSGTLNKSITDQFSIDISSGRVLVYQAFEK